jgi:hypothetical protein
MKYYFLCGIYELGELNTPFYVFYGQSIVDGANREIRKRGIDRLHRWDFEPISQEEFDELGGYWPTTY